MPAERETFESEPTCPACGYVARDAFEWPDESTDECEQCGATVRVERVVSVDYRSTEVWK